MASGMRQAHCKTPPQRKVMQAHQPGRGRADDEGQESHPHHQAKGAPDIARQNRAQQMRPDVFAGGEGEKNNCQNGQRDENCNESQRQA